MMKKLIPILLFALASLQSCGINYALVKDQLDHLCGPNHVYAFYGDDNRLLNAPVHTVRELARSSAPYTDIYVISHGWNFTLPEAIEQYQDYLRQFEHLREQELGEKFNPLFVLVGWTSVTRPLTTSAASILPFGLDRAVSWLTGIVDTLVFHIPSTWKQSLNAATNALGRNYPDEYLGTPHTDHSAIEEGPAQDLSFARRDFPVSAILYELLRLNDKGQLSQAGHPKPRIHCVGHSFGAKLIALATMESLRRFEYASGKPSGNCIESLVLFNAAMHPSEFRYSPSGFDTPLLDRSPYELLRQIPRKVFVYSNWDYANGLLFELSQIPLNNYHSHTAQRWIDNVVDEVPDGFFGQVVRAPAIVAGGAVQLGFSSVMGASMWAVRKVVNVPQDLWHHLSSYEGTRDWHWSLKYPMNLVHYFLPVNEIFGGRADQRGLFRHSTSAIGRTGLYRHAAGRSFELSWSYRHPSYGNTKPISEFASAEELKPQVYSEMCARVPVVPKYIPGSTAKGAFKDGDQFYSVDASAVLDTKLVPLVGAHGDLRSHACVKVQTRSGEVPTRQVDTTIRFLFNFTKTGSDEYPECSRRAPSSRCPPGRVRPRSRTSTETVSPTW